MTTNRRPQAFRMSDARFTLGRAVHARSDGARRIDALITHGRRVSAARFMPAIGGEHPQHGSRPAPAQITHDPALSTKERRIG